MALHVQRFQRSFVGAHLEGRTTKVETLFIFFLNHHPVDGSEVRRENHLGYTKPCTVNNGINYQPQLVPDFFHQLYHHGRLRPHLLGDRGMAEGLYLYTNPCTDRKHQRLDPPNGGVNEQV